MSNRIVEFIIRAKDEVTGKLKGISKETAQTGASASAAKPPIDSVKKSMEDMADGAKESKKALSDVNDEFSEMISEMRGSRREIMSSVGVFGMLTGAWTLGVNIGYKVCDVLREMGIMSEDYQKIIEREKRFLDLRNRALAEFVEEEKKSLAEINSYHDGGLKKLDQTIQKTEALEAARKKAAQAERARIAAETDINEKVALSQGWDPDAIKLTYADERRRQNADTGIEDAKSEAAAAERAINASKDRLDEASARVENFQNKIFDANQEITNLLRKLQRPEISEGARDTMTASLEMARKAKELAEFELAAAEERKAIANDTVEVAKAEAEAARKGIEAAMAVRERAESEYQADLESYWAKVDEEDRKRHEEELEAVRKQMEERRKLQEEADRAAHLRRVEDVRAEVQAWAQAQREAGDRLGRAKAASAQAWAWYRDPEAFARQRQEERDDIEAQKRFLKDEDKLKRLTNWRTRELSDEQEVVRRVVFTREEERAAQVALEAIAENTKNTNELLESLLTMA